MVSITGRLGGEEFAVVLKNASLEKVKKIAEQFRETVTGRKVIYGKQEISFTVSIDVAAIRGIAKDIHDDIEEALKMADDALYKAKARGRNCVVTVDSRMEDATPLCFLYS